MGKNIVLCLDGTGNKLRAGGNTNVVKTFAMLDLSDPEKQVAFYDPGVGTFSASGAWTPPARRLSRLMGLAFGTGVKTNLSEAYNYLIQNYEDGDKVFIFGFSRGAYTARALAGLLASIGLLRRGSENLIPYVIAVYARNKNWSDDDWTELHRNAGTFSRKVNGRTGLPITYLGLWDTVKAAGFLRWGDMRWLYTRQLPTVATVRHAVSIDEKRRPYRPYPVEPKAGATLPALTRCGSPESTPTSAAPSTTIRGCRACPSSGCSTVPWPRACCSSRARTRPRAR